MEKDQLNEIESLKIITQMINKAKQSYKDTGVSSMLWGIVITVCSLVRWAEVEFGFQLPFNIYWLTIIAVIPQILISIRESKKRNFTTHDDTYMMYVWMGFGISIGLLVFITAEAGNAAEKASFPFYEYVSSLFLLLYGIPTFITGTACKVRPMLLGAILCWVCSIVALYTNGKIDLLLTALSAIFAWLIPGILMQMEFRKAKKELAERNV